MSVSDRNASIVNKTKKLLKEYGYEIKLNHLYNVFSKLSNEPSWNVAKSKGTEFKNILQNQADLIIQENSFKKDQVLSAIQVNQILERMTRTLYFFLENDDESYRPDHLLMTFKKSTKIAKGQSEVIDYINKLYSEFNKRRSFYPSSIEKLNPIVIYISGISKLFYKSSDENIKNKIVEILKYGRSVGFIMITAPSKATKSDIPVEVIQNFVKKNLFKIDENSSFLIKDDNSKIKSPEINFIGAFGRSEDSESQDFLIRYMFYPEILTRLVNYDPNSFNFKCAELIKEILD